MIKNVGLTLALITAAFLPSMGFGGTYGAPALADFPDQPPVMPQNESGPTPCSGDLTQMEINDCWQAQMEAGDQRLTALLEDLEQVLTTAEVAQLRSIQRLWLDYRRRHCQWQADFFAGGSIRPMVYASCADSLTWERITALKFNLCEGQGMTGACEASGRYDRPMGEPVVP